MGAHAEVEPPPIIKVVLQRHDSDCGVAALATLLGVNYEEALVAVSAEAPKVLRNGVWMPQLQRAAIRLGAKLRRRAKFDADVDSGLLRIATDAWAHLVVLRAGLVIDTNGTLYDADVYLARQRKARLTLYVVEGA